MSGDYKWEIQMIAEAIALDEHNSEFYDLPQEKQFTVYTEATQRYVDRACDQADYLRKAERERI